MELYRHTQWLVRGHQGTTPAFSPMASRSQGSGQGERREASCSSSSTTEDTAEGPVEGWAPRSSIASFRAGAIECQICSGGGFEDSEGRGSTASAPTAKSGRSVRTCGETRGGVETSGRGRPRCQTFEDCIETGEESSSSASSWGAPRFVPPICRTSEKQVGRAEEHVREAKEAQVQLEEKLAGLRDLEALRAEALEEPRQRPQQSRLRALVAELQKERVQEVEANRTKKARTLAGSCTDLVHCLGGHNAQNPSEVMSTLIEAADSTLREVRGVQ